MRLPLIYVELTPEMFDLAEEHAKSFDGLYGDINTLAEDCDVTGSLAQQAVAKQFRLWHFEPDNSPMFDPNITSDEYDFMWRYEKIDVKGSPLGKDWHDVFPNSRFLIEKKKEESHKAKGLNRYLFVKIDYEYKKAIIVGLIGVNKFWNIANDCEGMKTKADSVYVCAKDLSPFKDFVYA